MADTGTLDRRTWQTALDEITQEHEGELVTIEILDPEIGHQHEAERLPFAYEAYDPKDDVVVVAVGGQSSRYPVVLRHMVQNPREIDVAPSDIAEPTIRIVDKDGTATLITFYREQSGTGS
ncbi:hypothetical protein AAW14_02350 [Streptomyces hygroscopicus]|uniref:DUF5335 family protein n=1 Tax=Streptomyces hygroscopicus TaxID=1912 RepID=UPI0022409AD8|nr:DUF5335 family protein [Streptomyces hygroscopicus]MCW7940934.1 hypothetical protein [Streptomyces hygroscopicus]